MNTLRGPRVAAARRGAVAVALALALGAGTAGCERVGNAYCDVFTSTRYCCERSGTAVWDDATRSCHALAPPMLSS